MEEKIIDYISEHERMLIEDSKEPVSIKHIQVIEHFKKYYNEDVTQTLRDMIKAKILGFYSGMNHVYLYIEK